MVSGAIDWNICPLVLGMTKGSIALCRWPRAIEPLVISNTMSVTSGAGDDNPSGAPWLTPFLFDL